MLAKCRNGTCVESRYSFLGTLAAMEMPLRFAALPIAGNRTLPANYLTAISKTESNDNQ